MQWSANPWCAIWLPKQKMGWELWNETKKKIHKCEFKVKLACTKKKRSNLCRWKSKWCMEKPHGANFTRLIMVQNLGRVIRLFLIFYSMINDGDCIEMVIKILIYFFYKSCNFVGSKLLHNFFWIKNLQRKILTLEKTILMSQDTLIKHHLIHICFFKFLKFLVSKWKMQAHQYPHFKTFTPI